MGTNNLTQQTIETQKQSGLGIAGMVIGIVALPLSCLVFGGILGIVGIILSIAGVTQKGKKTGMAVAGIVLNTIAIIIMVIIFVAAGSSGDETTNDNPSINAQADTKDDSAESKEEASDGTIIQEETKTSGENDKYYVGDTWENKYVSVAYDKCGEYESDNQFLQPSEGNKYVYATFTFENVGSSDTTVGYWDFDCYADGYACESTYGADDAAFSQTLSAGRKITGSVYFEVPESASQIEFEYSPNFWTSQKIVFVYQ